MYMYMHMYLRHDVRTFVRVEKFQSMEMKCVIEFDSVTLCLARFALLLIFEFRLNCGVV